MKLLTREGLFWDHRVRINALENLMTLASKNSKEVRKFYESGGKMNVRVLNSCKVEFTVIELMLVFVD